MFQGVAREVFSWTEGFAAYGFSAAHAASFAELAYASAYMRTNFPAEYLAAVLNSQPMGFYSPRAILNEARRIGSILPADVHLSGEGFTARIAKLARPSGVGLKYARGLSRKAPLHPRGEEQGSLLLHARPVQEDRGRARRFREPRQGGFLDALSPTRDAGGAALLAEVSILPKKPRAPRGGARTSCLSRTRRAAPGTEGRTSSSCGAGLPASLGRAARDDGVGVSLPQRLPPPALSVPRGPAGSGSRAGRSSSCPTAPGHGRPGSWNPCRGRPQRVDDPCTSCS